MAARGKDPSNVETQLPSPRTVPSRQHRKPPFLAAIPALRFHSFAALGRYVQALIELYAAASWTSGGLLAALAGTLGVSATCVARVGNYTPGTSRNNGRLFASKKQEVDENLGRMAWPA
ncbi:hypothetical protein CGMCC3_g8053 [Colletotrichum fructicola]|nr:uncharacterized protein CGMCC3_g8053 [Colletotrichum fructicola]KAE9575790.1 hypothetical protein CGMCC3_g8053 [Colletotrichum fructicola]